MAVQQLDELAMRIEAWMRERNWAAIGAVDALLRDLVAEALADPSPDRPRLEQTINRLRELYRQAESSVETEKNQSGHEMTLARRNLRAARSYLANR